MKACTDLEKDQRDLPDGGCRGMGSSWQAAPLSADPCRLHLRLVPLAFTTDAPRVLRLELVCLGQFNLRTREEVRCGSEAAAVPIVVRPPAILFDSQELFARPGAYRLELHADPGLLLDANATALDVTTTPSLSALQLYVAPLPATAPTAPFVDRDAAALMLRYGHREVWTYGNRSFECRPEGEGYTATVRDHRPLEILSIERVPYFDVWQPLGMSSTTFEPGPGTEERLAIP